MTRRFSSAELSFSRNRVPIAQIVKTLFGSVCQNEGGKLLFACPLCAGLDTSIYATHNLVRCFCCQRNFNPIELVMHQRKIDFVDSVKWLQSRMPPVDQNAATARIDNAGLCAIGHILSNVMPSLSRNKSEPSFLKSIVEKISHLEQRLKHLDRVVSDLQSSLNR